MHVFWTIDHCTVRQITEDQVRTACATDLFPCFLVAENPGATRNGPKIQAHKELPPAASSETTDGAGDEPSSATPKSKTGKTGGGKAPAVAAPGGPSWADRMRDFQINVPASAAYDELTSSPDSAARGGAGGAAEVGAEQEQQGGEDGQDPSSWDGVGVHAATVIRHRRQFDVRCKAYEVWWVLFLLW